jgi:hypothetical protein
MVDTPVWSNEWRAEYSTCRAWRAAVLQRLERVGRLEAVIIGRAHWYSDLLVLDGKPLSEEQSEPAWKAGLERTLAVLSRIAPRIVLIQPPPRPASDVPACISKNPTDKSRCSFVHDPTQWNDRFIAHAETALVARTANVHVIDLTQQICPTQPCSVYAPDGTVIYRDFHHITATFSTSLWHVMGEQLEAILR